MSLGDRVRRLRKQKNLTQIQLVAAVRRRGGDLSQSQLSAIEKDEVERPGALLELAAALGSTPAELLGRPGASRRQGDDEEARTPIRHYVGAGDEIHIIDGDMPHGYAPSPPGFEGDRGAAAIVRGDSMRPIFDPGDMLYFRSRRPPSTLAKDLPERPVIVQVLGGPLYVKKMIPGTRKGRFHLISVNPVTPILQDQLVESIAQIEWVKPKLR